MENKWTDEVDVLAYAIHHAKSNPHCRYTNTDRVDAERILEQLQKLGFSIGGMMPWSNKVHDENVWKGFR